VRDAELVKIFTRRALLIGVGEAALFAVLVARLVQLQVFENKKYTALSDRNSIRIKLVPPARGIIYDEAGEVLADNRNAYEIQMIPEEIIMRGRKVDEILDIIGTKISLSDAEKDRIRANIAKKRPFFPVIVKSHLSWDDMAKIQINNLELPGVFVEETRRRNYPNGEVGAHTIGYVAAPDENDVRRDPSPLLSLPDFKVGKTGIERVRDSELRGSGGEIVQVVNAVGRVIETIESRRRLPTAGQNVHLTINRELQRHAFATIKEESASAIVMDIWTGEILCLASVPAFDPNMFQNEEDGIERFRELVRSPRFPFVNKAIEGLYAPGSTFKMITALAGLAEGKITASSRYHCPGYLDFADSRYHCWKHEGHGWCDLERALAESCDIFFYHIATKVNMDTIQEFSDKFGLTSLTGIELPGEKVGQIPSRAWKRNFRSEAWFTGDTIISSIGQGFNLTTPIGLAVMTSRIANGGVAVKPHIIKWDERDQQFESMGLNAQHLAMVRAGMFAVLNKPGGTARGSAINVNGALMSGKTGTSQVRRITRAERLAGRIEQEDLPWHHRNHALFVGYAPYRNPRFAVSVVVEHGRSGSGTAAPIARNLMRKTLEIYGTGV